MVSSHDTATGLLISNAYFYKGSYRKKLLLLFAVLGSVSSMLFIVVKPGAYPLAALWTILSNVNPVFFQHVSY
jgi:hypothetical protein